MKTITIRYADVEITAVSDSFRRAFPGRRINFFDCPWSLSSPGVGKLLVTATQLAAIEEAVLDNKGKGDLDLEVYKDGHFVEDESVFLYDLYVVKASPIVGLNFYIDGEKDIYHQENLDNNKGLWELEIQDQRSIQSMFVTDIGSNKSVFNVKQGDAWDTDTVKEDEEPWDLKELIEKLFSEINEAIPDVSNIEFELDTFLRGILTAIKLQNINLTGIPTLLGIDLLVGLSGLGVGFKFNPSNKTNKYSLIAGNEGRVLEFLESVQGSLLQGGRPRFYAPTTIPESMNFITKSEGDLESSDEITNSLPVGMKPTSVLAKSVEGTKVPMYYPSTGVLDTLFVSYLAKTRFVYDGIYRGFLESSLDAEYPFSLVSFDWGNGVPTTTVHSSSISFLKSILDGPFGRYLKDMPLRWHDLSKLFELEGDQNAPWWGEITEFNPSTGIGKAIPVEGDFQGSYTRKQTEDEEDEEARTVVIGVGSTHYCICEGQSRYGLFTYNGPDVTPKWSLSQLNNIGFNEPSSFAYNSNPGTHSC